VGGKSVTSSSVTDSNWRRAYSEIKKKSEEKNDSWLFIGSFDKYSSWGCHCSALP